MILHLARNLPELHGGFAVFLAVGGLAIALGGATLLLSLRPLYGLAMGALGGAILAPSPAPIYRLTSALAGAALGIVMSRYAAKAFVALTAALGAAGAALYLAFQIPLDPPWPDILALLAFLAGGSFCLVNEDGILTLVLPFSGSALFCYASGRAAGTSSPAGSDVLFATLSGVGLLVQYVLYRRRTASVILSMEQSFTTPQDPPSK